MTTYINFIGGPSSGKSTAALYTAHRLKTLHQKTELVPEVAKDLVWEKREGTLKIQPYVTIKQYRNIIRLDGQVDYVVTDAPVIMGIVYGRYHSRDLPPSYGTFLSELYAMSDNRTIFLEREFPYQTYGRHQDEDGAKQVDEMILGVLDEFGVPYVKVKPTKVPDYIDTLLFNAL